MWLTKFYSFSPKKRKEKKNLKTEKKKDYPMRFVLLAKEKSQV